MPTTTNIGYRYPAASAAPDVPGDIYNLALDLDGSTFMRGSIGTAGTAAGQRAIVNSVEYRWDGGAWRIWTWIAIPFATYADYSNSAANGGALMECNITGGIVVLNYSLYKATMNADVTYLTMKPGFRPATDAYTTGVSQTSGGARNPATIKLTSNGALSLFTNLGASLDYLNGTISYRSAN